MNQVGFVFAILVSLVVADRPESEAKQFIDKANDDLKKLNDEYEAKDWAYAIAPNEGSDKQTQEYNDVNNRMSKFQQDIAKKIAEFKWQDFKDPKLKQEFLGAQLLRELAVSHEEVMDMVNTKNAISKLMTDPRVKEYKAADGKPLISYSDVEKRVKEVGVNADELKYYWTEAHNNVARAEKEHFQHYVDLENKIAQANHFNNFADMFQANYQMDNFENTMDRLYTDIKPLYEQLHAYIRHKLWVAYNRDNNIIDPKGPIPASLLGWKWGSVATPVYDIVAPYPDKIVNITQALKNAGVSVHDMGKKAEEFFVSLGLNSYPEDFWKESNWEKNPNVDCTPNDYTFAEGGQTKYRVRLCADVSQEGHTLLFTWLGVIQYAMLANQPYFIRRPSRAIEIAFQDVITDFSMAPDYLKTFGALDNNFQIDDQLTINTLFKEALDDVFFLPFGLAWDKWRWEVAKGNIKPENYNCKYWEMRTNLQGVAPPIERSNNDFDPGSNINYIAGNEYIQYFISTFNEYDMIRGLCRTAGHYDPQRKKEQPLAFCDIHGNKDVGKNLRDFMSLGASEPWTVALGKITGNARLDSTGLTEYYEPLYNWLVTENRNNGATPGWTKDNKCK